MGIGVGSCYYWSVVRLVKLGWIVEGSLNLSYGHNHYDVFHQFDIG